MNQARQHASSDSPLAWADRNDRRFVVRLFLLGLLCPGAPYHQRGRVGQGTFVNVAMASLWLVFIIVWSVVKFSPLIPFVAFGTVWLLTVAMIAADAARLPRAERERYEQRTPSMASLVAFMASTWVGPLLLLFVITNSVFWTIARVRDESMYPTLLPGDLVLIDRRAYDLQGPSPGDVIAYKREGRIAFGRIIAGPGESVSRLDGHWYVDGSIHAQAPVSSNDAASFRERAGASPGAVDARWESNGRRVYIVAGQPASALAGNTEPKEWAVPDDSLFVLHDNRSQPTDSRTEESVSFRDVEGMVLYIMDSSVSLDAVAKERAGRVVQAPNRAIRASASR